MVLFVESRYQRSWEKKKKNGKITESLCVCESECMREKASAKVEKALGKACGSK